MNTPVPAQTAAPAGAVAAVSPGETAGPAALPGAAQPSAGAPARCPNCDAPLGGKYCSQCGQRHHDQPVHHFRHFLREATEDLTHADSRLWRTLAALLFRPGFLTWEFLQGRRARYLPPVRLYLIVSLIFFVIVGLESRNAQSYVVISYSGNSFHYKVIPPADSGASGAIGRAPARPASAAVNGLGAIAPTRAARQRICQQMGAYIEQHGGSLAQLGPRAAQSCLTVLAHGGVARFNQIAEHNLERAMFLFLPLLALLMKPLYRRPPRYYVEHLLFFVHAHAFLFVVLGLGTLLGTITPLGVIRAPVDTAIAVYIPIYFYRAMRQVYGQDRWLTLSKLTALGVAYVFLGVVMLAATFTYSFMML